MLSHSVSPDSKQVVIAGLDAKVRIFDLQGESFRDGKETEQLEEHDQKVLGVHWSKKKGHLLSCGEDRNAYVWEREESGKWKPELVHLGSSINRAALCCQWSPEGDKFAIGTGANRVCVCYYEASQSWWVSKIISKHLSSVTAISWNPENNAMLATASTDQNVRLFSAYIKGVDDSSLSEAGKFGTLLLEIPSGGWVHSLDWNPSGAKLAFASHDCTLTIVDGNNEYAATVTKTRYLPFFTVRWVSDNLLVVGGADCFPYLYEVGDDNICKLKGVLTGPKKEEATAKTGVGAARAMWGNMANTGQESAVKTLTSKHQNAISDIVVIKQGEEFAITTISHEQALYHWKSTDVTDP